MPYLYVERYTDAGGVYRAHGDCGTGFGVGVYRCKRINTVLKSLLNNAQDCANFYNKRCKFTIQRLHTEHMYNADVNDAAPVLWEREFFPQNLEI
jgi:hypothetical protein